MVGVVKIPWCLLQGWLSMDGKISVFTLTGRLLWNYDYGEEE